MDYSVTINFEQIIHMYTEKLQSQAPGIWNFNGNIYVFI